MHTCKEKRQASGRTRYLIGVAVAEFLFSWGSLHSDLKQGLPYSVRLGKERSSNTEKQTAETTIWNSIWELTGYSVSRGFVPRTTQLVARGTNVPFMHNYLLYISYLYGI